MQVPVTTSVSVRDIAVYGVSVVDRALRGATEWRRLVGGRCVGPAGKSLGDFRVGDLDDVRAVAVGGVDVGSCPDFEREDDLAAVGRVARGEGEVVIGPDIEVDSVCSGAVGADLDEVAAGRCRDEMLAIGRPCR